VLKTIRRLVIVLLLFAVGEVRAQHTYFTTFAGTENPISERGNWKNGATDGIDWCNVQKTSGFAFGVEPCSTIYRDPTAVLTGLWGPNQGAAATLVVGAFTGVPFPESEVRLNTTITAHNVTGYEIYCTVGTAGTHPNPQLDIVRWNGPPPDSTNSNNAFTVIAEADGVTCKNGDILSATNVDGNIQAFINGRLITGAVDTTYRNGSPGIGFNAGEGSQYAQNGITSFSATDAPSSFWVGVDQAHRMSDPAFVRNKIALDLARMGTNSAERPRLKTNGMDKNASFRNRQLVGSPPTLASTFFFAIRRPTLGLDEPYSTSFHPARCRSRWTVLCACWLERPSTSLTRCGP
jgi:hypothetical protein